MFKRIYNRFLNFKRIISNYFLCLKYPFLKIDYDYFSAHPKCIYEYTWLNCVPEGWRDLAMDMFKELKKTKIKFYFKQIKEKFGELRCFYGLESFNLDDYNTIYNIVNKYSNISARVCIVCGKQAQCISHERISPYCKKHIGDRKYTKIK